MTSIKKILERAKSLDGEELAKFLNELDEVERKMVTTHLESERLNQTLDPMNSIDRLAKTGGDEPTLDPTDSEPESARDPFAATIGPNRPDEENEREPVSKSFGDYELLSEIARGGMGVVYKARHKPLNRIVALKMILSGQFASPEHIARFHVEAEAAAKLDHPSITPIYEIGADQGQPYFAMKLIEAGSLADIVDDFKNDFKSAAKIVAEVAHAIHHAHQRGILHRDLKPNNILLDENRKPLVTDFGLAKIGDRDSQHTQTGAILGTPAYMAPEQAGGEKTITTAADIYSLGAILYRLLTGKATYEGSSPFEIVRKSLEEEPQSPRSWNAAIPLDLELICQKCLQRDPKQRYNSAADLADDLERWLNGEPVSLRAPSLSSVAGLWMKQNLQMAGGAALIGCSIGLLLMVVIYLAAFSANFDHAASTYQQVFPSLERPLFAIPFNSPDWMFPVGLILWPLLIAICGFLTVVVTKPKSRNAAASVGMIAGVCCCGLMGMVGTLGPLMSFTVGRSNEDIALLSRAAYGNEDVAQEAKRTMSNRYPDLLNYNEGDRGELVRRKIQSDLTVGIPTGLWSGMIVFMSAVPLVVIGAMFSWHVRTQTYTLFGSFVRYVDVVFALCLLVSFAIVFFVTRSLGAGIYVPDTPVALLILGSLLLAFWVALRSQHWLIRIPVHILWIGCVAYFCSQALKAPYAEQIAFQAIQRGDLEAAAEAFELRLRANPSNITARKSAGTIYAELGDQDRYRFHCQQALKHSTLTRYPEVADQSAKLCFLIPDPQLDLSQAFELSDRAIKLGGDSHWESWFVFCKGLAEFRQGHHEGSLEWIAKIDREHSFILNCTADMVKAMALKQLGKTVESQNVFDSSTSHFEKAWLELLDQNARDANWCDRIVYEILRDEAAIELGISVGK